MLKDINLLIPLELIDWSVASYARDAGQLGLNKTIFQIGHFNFEELGMKYAVEWIKPLVADDIPIKFVRSGDIYNYII